MKIENIDGVLLRKAIKGAVKYLEVNKEEINSLNVFPVPDGDTGTNMLLTVKSAMKESLTVEEDEAWRISGAFSKGSLMGARGNSGVILSQIFRGFSSGLEENSTIDVQLMAKALKEASSTAYKAVMKPTEGTILTVIRECGTYAMEIKNEETDIITFLKRVVEQGYIVLNKTPDMLPVLKQAGVVDAGGKGLLRLFEGAVMALENRLDDIDEAVDYPSESVKETKELHKEDIEFGYCTEFMIKTEYSDINKLRDDFAKQGDSLLVVGGDGIIKVHIHTNNPGHVLEDALELGYLTDIKIDNMRLQHEEVLLKDELEKARLPKAKPGKKYSIISVSTGDGFEEVFKDLNVDITVTGGQTMNPSTEDFLKAIDETDGENIIILPNNSNIILAAEQTKHLSDRNIFVLPTKNLPQGITALISFDESMEAQENIDNMTEGFEQVKAGEITYAVRDTEMNGYKIKKDDIIGISGKDILSSGSNVNEVSMDLIKNLVDEDTSIITCFYGQDTMDEDANLLVEKLEEIYDDIDIELIYGGQPLYYYLFSIE